MKVEIWFDFACPFCYIGEKKFEMALANFQNKEDVEIQFRSFKLNMADDALKGKDIHQVIADKYHISYQQAKDNNDRIAKAASEIGLDFRFDILKLSSTELAHEIAHFAQQSHKGAEVINRFFKGYFEEGLDLSDKETLMSLAQEAELDLAILKDQLENGTLKSKVQQDEDLARQLGIRSIPQFTIDNKTVISGAQDSETFLKALTDSYAATI